MIPVMLIWHNDSRILSFFPAIFRSNAILRIFKIYAEIAQLVEQLIRNEQVVGSNPILGSSEINRTLRQNV
jgi:hypothetical protein